MLGATGGIGQPLSLLLKLSPLVDHVALYDILNTAGNMFRFVHLFLLSKVNNAIASIAIAFRYFY